MVTVSFALRIIIKIKPQKQDHPTKNLRQSRGFNQLGCRHRIADKIAWNS